MNIARSIWSHPTQLLCPRRSPLGYQGGSSPQAGGYAPWNPPPSHGAGQYYYYVENKPGAGGQGGGGPGGGGYYGGGSSGGGGGSWGGSYASGWNNYGAHGTAWDRLDNTRPG